MHSLARDTHTHRQAEACTNMQRHAQEEGKRRKSKQMLWQVAQLNRQVEQRKVAPAKKLELRENVREGTEREREREY